LAADWRRRVDRWRSSGLTITEFCQRERVSPASFFQWRKRLNRPVSAADRLPTRAGTGARLRRDASEATVRFVELPRAAWPVTASMQIALPGGTVITLSNQASTEALTAIIRAALLGSQERDTC
jgi:hypothetical protein